MRYFATADWVELFCSLDPFSTLEQMHKEDMKKWYSPDGYRVTMRPYGTRVYKCVAEVYIKSDILCVEDGVKDWCPLLTVTFHPLSARSSGGIMRDDMCHVKVANYWLYRDDWHEVLQHALRHFRINPIKLSRVDLAVDWQNGVSGIAAVDVMKGLMNRKYYKIHQPSWRANGTDKDTINWHSMAFGSKSSPVFTRFYNKTLELDTTGKDYIRDCWKSAGFNLQRDVYRVEFQLTDLGTSTVDVDTGEVVNIEMEQIIDRQDIAALFFHYAQHYFDIRKVEPGKKRYDCEPIGIFPDGALPFVVLQRPRYFKTSRTDRMVVRQMIVSMFAMKSTDERVSMFNAIKAYVQAKRSKVLCDGAYRLLLDVLHSDKVNPDTLVDEMFELTREHFTRYDDKGLWIYEIVNDCCDDYWGDDMKQLGRLGGT